MVFLREEDLEPLKELPRLRLRLLLKLRLVTSSGTCFEEPTAPIPKRASVTPHRTRSSRSKGRPSRSTKTANPPKTEKTVTALYSIGIARTVSNRR